MAVQGGDALRLRVALRNGAADAPDRLRGRIADTLSDLGVPRPSVEVETFDALERSPGGKLQMIVPAARIGPRAAALELHIRPRRTDI
jgi:hypothetical protein